MDEAKRDHREIELAEAEEALYNPGVQRAFDRLERKLVRDMVLYQGKSLRDTQQHYIQSGTFLHVLGLLKGSLYYPKMAENIASRKNQINLDPDLNLGKYPNQEEE